MARILAAQLLGILLSPGLYAAKQTPAEVIKSVGFDQKLDGQLPLDVVFRDEAGRSIRLGDYFGRKPVLLALVYYGCPMLCQMELNGLVKMLRAVQLQPGKDFEVVVASFDAQETPAQAAEKKNLYLRYYGHGGTEHGWHFLTGDAEAIARLTGAAGYRYVYDEETKQFAHASGLLVATPEGKLSRYFYGIEYAPRDVRLGLVEASAGKIGTAADRVLLYCYHYDPKTGKYGFAILTVIRLLGALTVALIAGFVVTMLRRERRGELAVSGGKA